MINSMLVDLVDKLNEKISPKVKESDTEKFDIIISNPPYQPQEVFSTISSGQNTQLMIVDAISNLIKLGKENGIPNIFSQYKWREFIVADKLRHCVNKKVSNGSHADALDGAKLAEYKSQALSKKNFAFLLHKEGLIAEQPKPQKGRVKTKLPCRAIYNGAYDNSIINEYRNIDHYHALFFDEEVIIIYKIDSNYVADTLIEQLMLKEPGATTNLNTISFDGVSYDSDVISVVWKSEYLNKEKGLDKIMSQLHIR